MTLNERDRRALMLGGLALLAIGLYLFGVDPLWQRYGNLVADHEAHAGEIARFQGNETKAAYYARQIEQWEAEVGELSPPRPYGEQISSVTEKIISVAQKNNTQLKDLSPSSSASWPDDPRLQRATILVDAETSWPDVFKFIGALYRAEGILSIERMELTGDPKKGGQLNVKLNVLTLVQAPEDNYVGWSR